MRAQRHPLLGRPRGHGAAVSDDARIASDAREHLGNWPHGDEHARLTQLAVIWQSRPIVIDDSLRGLMHVAVDFSDPQPTPDRSFVAVLHSTWAGWVFLTVPPGDLDDALRSVRAWMSSYADASAGPPPSRAAVASGARFGVALRTLSSR